MFEGFHHSFVETSETEIHVTCGGEGPPLLLLHGYPQTHVAWHKVAPLLRERFSLVIPDLRGYGDSGAPEPDAEHRAYSKRVMAQDMVEVMLELEFESFGVAGHDRGGRVAYRMALDHPERVGRLAVLDMVPTLDTFEMTDKDMALGTYHWFFLPQPAPLPETLIGHDPDYYLEHTIRSWLGRQDAIDDEAMEEYKRCFRKSTVIRACCEDYRAGATVDAEDDQADRDAGRRITCPGLTLWGEHSDGATPDPIEVWRRWADDVTGFPIESGHFLMEESPVETAEALGAILLVGLASPVFCLPA